VGEEGPLMKHEELGPYLVSSPLYQEVEIGDAEFKEHERAFPATGVYRELILPKLVRRHCDTCDGERNWEILGRSDEQFVGPGFFVRTYKCKDCEQSRLSVWFSWRTTGGKTMIVKGGQYPKLQITIPKAFGEALGRRKSLYLKAMTLRNNNYGIGAVVYLRRVIEETTDDMLALLEQHMVAAGSPEPDIEALRAVKKSTQFEEKVSEAAKVIPEHFRPGGVNPFADLYKLVSIGLHNKTDEECCAIVDGMDGAFKFIYTRWKAYVDETKAYKEAAKATRAVVDKMQKSS
jgi:hypothetical protein